MVLHMIYLRFIVFMLLFFCAGCGQQNAPPNSGERNTFKFPNAPFSVYFPSSPVKLDSAQADLTMYACRGEGTLEMMALSKIVDLKLSELSEEEQQEVLQRSLQGGVNNIQGTVIEQQPVVLQGKYPAREFTASYTNAQTPKGIMRGKTILLDGKIIAIFVNGDTKDMASPQVKDCLGSIKIE